MTKKVESNVESEKGKAMLKCGLVMPISSIDDCTEQHWLDVKLILTEAIGDSEFKANLVSDSDDVGIIQKRIIQNLYDNPIVVCDVSGKNPNVMFELGIRLAFDKPTIIVKDDATTYSFDTSPIEHLEYPRDLRFNKIVEFKKSLTEKIKATYKKATTDPSYTTFLKHFGKFHVAQLETTEVSKEDFIIEELRELKRFMVMRDKRDRNDMLHSRSRKMIHYDEEVISAMREAFSRAIDHFGREGRKIAFPEMEEEFSKYIVENSSVPKFFDSKREFDDCLRNVIYS